MIMLGAFLISPMVLKADRTRDVVVMYSLKLYEKNQP